MDKKVEPNKDKKSLQIISARLLKETPVTEDKELQPEPEVIPPPIIAPPPKKEDVAETAKVLEKKDYVEAVKHEEQVFRELPDLQAQEAEIYRKLKEGFLFDKTENVVSISLDPSMILKADLAIFRLLFEKRMKGIIICAGRPSEFYIKLLSSKGFNPNLLYYIDLITFHSRKKPEEKQNIKLVPHPSDFTAIDIAFSQAVEELDRIKLGDERLFLLIDGIASHQLYAKPSALGAFIHILVSKARTFNIFTIILLSDGVDPILTSTIKTFSDKITSINQQI